MKPTCVWLATCFLIGPLVGPSVSANTELRKIVQEKGITGGIIVHLDCGSGERTAALRFGDRFLVQGLDRSPENVSAARARLRAEQAYGPVTIALYNGRQLPYIDRSVNVVVAENEPTVSEQEMLRVLAPGGIVLVRQGDGWRTLTKERSPETDDWTHYLYDATGNAVSRDTEVASPFYVQWYSGPKWARSHDRLTSMPALVSSGGKIFYIIDEGPISDIILPADWKLIAKDAYNGVTLWKRDIQRWENHLRAFRAGPTQQPRRLVSDGNRLFAALNLGDPVQVLDGSTGQTIKTFAGTENAEEMVLADGVLFVVVDTSPMKGRDDTSRYDFAGQDERGRTRGYRDYYQKAIVALDAETGRGLWRRDDADTAAIIPSTLVADSDRVYYQNDNAIIALDRKAGKTLWTTARDKVRNRDSYNAPAFAIADGVVLSADRSGSQNESPDAKPWLYSATAKNNTGELLAFAATSGEQLWSVPCAEAYGATQDVFVINGLVYVGQNPRRHQADFARAYDLRTGEEKLQLDSASAFVSNHHHRCWRNKATPNFILMGRTGIEFIDVTGKDTVKNSWTRGACQYGIMPANGLVYTPPHSCGCYIQVKLSGFFAFAPESQRPPMKENRFTERLVKGAAFGAVSDQQSAVSEDAWPTYRRDAARSSSVAARIEPTVEEKWSVDFDGPVTSPVSANGVVYLAEKDQHAVWAVSAATGEKLWSFVADGYIDSPPTIWQGMALFGTRGGSVYALNAADGALVWQFRAATANVQQAYDGRLESLWPVHGSVLVTGEELFFAAGRSSYVDDGLYVYKLNPRTGELLAQKRIYSRDETGRPAEAIGGRGQSYPGGLSDVLSADEQHVFMRDVTFTRDVEMLEPTIAHIHSAAGYLDDSWAHRTYWFFGTYMAGGYGGWGREGNQKYSGRIMVRDGDDLFAYGRTNYFNDFTSAPKLGRYREQGLYQLYAASIQPRQQSQPPKPKAKRAKKGPAVRYTWTASVPVYVRAMVLAENALFVAGPKHILKDETADDPQTLAAQTAWFKGKKGAEIHAVSPESGEILASTKLASPPVFDGMIAADGNLYVSTIANKLTCLGQ
ncbi:MAG: PQQ-binding-like beta-propeller repeat protein [Planctomycetes bacterium]|nr:PQQ-binding-like beta-propeller repeat protein [Planctomycetota bacterium]MBL7037711.1 PQQ-binding-like beta-propeller repeat protein [Pirellulaceae bacterium]